MQDQPVMSVLLELLRNEPHQPFLYLDDVFAGRNSSAVGNAKYVRIDRDSGLTERGV